MILFYVFSFAAVAASLLIPKIIIVIADLIIFFEEAIEYHINYPKLNISKLNISKLNISKLNISKLNISKLNISEPKIKKKLKFIHITKTAGTSIEIIGKTNKQSWGMYHAEYGSPEKKLNGKRNYPGFWHQPFSLKAKELKAKYDWFVVVRNPYTRTLSEFNFYYRHIAEFKEKLQKNLSDHLEKHYLPNCFGLSNKLKITLDLLKSIDTTPTKKAMNELTRQLINQRQDNFHLGNHFHYHFLPQYLYLDPDGVTDVRILKFENVAEEFNQLMTEYQLNIQLTEKHNVSNNIFTISDFDQETISLINQVYQKDFDLFDYSLFNPTVYFIDT